MKVPRLWIHLFAAIALSLLPGCTTVESVHPLSSAREAVVDKRLEGLWKSTDIKDRGYVYIAYRNNSKIASALMVQIDDGNQITSNQMDFYVTHTPNNDYLNLFHMTQYGNGTALKNQWGTYQFVKYHFNWLGQLIYSQVNSDAVFNAVEKKQIEGKATYSVSKDAKGKPQKSPSDVKLTDSPANLLNYFEHDKAAFSNPVKLKHVDGL